jgi:hypothetical protein
MNTIEKINWGFERQQYRILELEKYNEKMKKLLIGSVLEMEIKGVGKGKVSVIRDENTNDVYISCPSNGKLLLYEALHRDDITLNPKEG